MPNPNRIQYGGLFVDALAFGNDRDATTIASALSAIGTDERILVISPGGWDFGTVTIPDNVTLAVSRDAIITGTYVVLQCDIIAGHYQIFDIDASFDLKIDPQYVTSFDPKWIGVDGDIDIWVSGPVGDDNNGGLFVWTHAFETIQAAVDLIPIFSRGMEPYWDTSGTPDRTNRARIIINLDVVVHDVDTEIYIDYNQWCPQIIFRGSPSGSPDLEPLTILNITDFFLSTFNIFRYKDVRFEHIIFTGDVYYAVYAEKFCNIEFENIWVYGYYSALLYMYQHCNFQGTFHAEGVYDCFILEDHCSMIVEFPPADPNLILMEPASNNGIQLYTQSSAFIYVLDIIDPAPNFSTGIRLVNMSFIQFQFFSTIQTCQYGIWGMQGGIAFDNSVLTFIGNTKDVVMEDCCNFVGTPASASVYAPQFRINAGAPAVGSIQRNEFVLDTTNKELYTSIGGVRYKVSLAIAP